MKYESERQRMRSALNGEQDKNEVQREGNEERNKRIESETKLYISVSSQTNLDICACWSFTSICIQMLTAWIVNSKLGKLIYTDGILLQKISYIKQSHYAIYLQTTVNY